MTTVIEQVVDFNRNGRSLVTRYTTECGCRVERRDYYSKEDLYKVAYGGEATPSETEIVLSCPHEQEWYL